MLQEFATFADSKFNPATVKAYKTDIQQFLDFCAQKTITPDKVTAAHAAQYREHLGKLTPPIQASTVSRKLSALLAYYEWHVKVRKTMSENPFTGVQMKRDKARIRRRRSTVGADYDKLLNVIPITDRSCARDRCVIRVMFDTKVRLRDILALNAEHFDFKSGCVTNPKWKASHPLSQETVNEMRAYYSALPHKEPGRPLFVNRNNRRISDRSIRRRLTEHCDKVGIKGLSPYAFSGTQKNTLK